MIKLFSISKKSLKSIIPIFLIFVILLNGQEPAPIKAGVAPKEQEYAIGINALHYNVEIGIGDTEKWIEGHVSIRMKVENDFPLMELDFSGLEVLGVAINGSTVEYEYKSGKIKTDLSVIKPKNEFLVEVQYRGVPDDGLIIGENIHGNQSVFVDNWPNRTRFWLPSIDHPADKATVSYTVHAPKDWKVVANGYQTNIPSETPKNAIGPKTDRLTWTWAVTVPISSYNMVIGAADMEIRTVGLAACGDSPASQRVDGCVEVTYWVYPEDVEKAAPSFGRGAEMVDYFTNTIGAFPFEKLANVQSSTRFGGMENASAIFYSEKAISSGRNIEGTVSHEIAHQWFGDAVTESDWHHLWLSEGFATYFGALFFEYADGAEDFRKRMENSRQRILKSKVSNRPIVDPEEKDLFKLLNSNNYPKGGWVLHMLRGILGDELFFKGIKAYYSQFTHQAVLTDDFQRSMEAVSGRSLDWFFDQWTLQPGFPQLSYEENWQAKSGTKGILTVTIWQTQKKEWPIFKIPTEVCWSDDCRSVSIDKRKHVFQFEFDEKPNKMGMIDPNGWVLKEIQ
ncbi:MAG: M1 family metallopeptidase [Candidatus Marinimicrobia bacterium]|nr:M1 family metallopeptidase [Candidatus Neomarinimicrobiota bacterium]MDP6611792.1 M1 family metallopeptidase [Candidatus Neomarinimicrobiota bacterium]